MPYINTEQVKLIRQTLKSQFPKFKFSVRRDGYSAVRVSIQKGPLQVPKDGAYQTVNQYYIKSHWDKQPEWLEFLLQVNDIVGMSQKTLYHDYDYGDIPNYYYSISIGQWDRQYQTI